MSAINFNTANQTYRQLMGNGLLYSVPRFQRDYSWTDEEWDDLWADMQQVVEPGGESAHYMGYLVLQSRDNKNFDIIDGQQRMTTLSILVLSVLAALNKLIENGIEPDNNKRRLEQLRGTFIGYLDPVTLVPRSKLTLNRNNNSYYQNYLVPLQKLPVRNLKATEHLMRKAFDWFKEKVWNEYGVQGEGARVAGLLDTLADRLFFTVITVTDELNAYKVFETLNARGVKLSSTDLLKNYLFSIVHRESANDELELNALEERWEILVGKLGSESFPDFLRAHWNSANKFVRHSELFKTIRGTIFNRQRVFELVREMEQDADVYVALSNPEDSLWNNQQRRYIEEMKMFNVRQAYPLLLAAKRKFSETDFSMLLKACSVISFRYNVIGNLPTNEQERIYTSAAEQISSGQLHTIQDVLRALRNIYPSDDAFSQAFSEKILKTTQTRNKRIVRYILFSVEHQLSGQELDFDSELYSIEHILPEHPETGWEAFSDQEHEQFVYRLGNMTLLRSDQNRGLQNKPYAEKQPVLANANIHLTKKTAQKYAVWTTKQIVDTQRWMADQAKSIWKISQIQ
ncbi:MAG: DUF262 domain-containing protein [Saprospiraceae bacterium]|nr:DUF262 domain-containing protein [Saprospiraceae bacterium]